MYPWETKQDALNTVNLAKYLMREGLADTLQGTVTIPYPGTPLYDQAVENGWLRVPPGDWERYGMTEPVLNIPQGMTPDELMQLSGAIYSGVIHPKFAWKVIRDIKSIDDIAYIYRSARALFGHLFDFKGRRRKIRSTLMARKNMMSVERRKARRIGTPAQMAKA